MTTAGALHATSGTASTSAASTSGAASSSPWHFWAYFNAHLHQDLTWLWDHVWLSALPVVIGLAIALPLGWLASRYKWIYPPMLSIAGLLYTIPSIALFVLIPPLLGLKALNPIQVPIALTIYSVALLVRVVADGLGSVPEDVVQAATAMGFGPIQRLFKVELPIAVPVIAAGLRVATVSNVSIVAVAGTIGLANLGQLFTTGFQLSTPTAYYPPIVLGIVLCVALALAFDVVIVTTNRLLTPWRRAVQGR
jgi:osmoprotectant transport system permease protein